MSATLKGGNAGSTALLAANAAGRILDTVAVTVAVGSLVAMFLALMADVIVRYMTTSGLGWPSEVPNLLFPWLIMGGIVVGAHRSAHIAATGFIDWLSTPNARILAAATQVLVFGVFSALALFSLQVIAVTGQQVFPITRVPQLYAYSAMTFGCGGIALSALINFVRVLMVEDPRKPVEPVGTEHQI